MCRWGSEEAFNDEMSARKANAEASYEASKQTFNDRESKTANGPAGSPPPDGESSVPSRPHIFGLGHETNLVGVKQQEDHVVRGEKYGFYTVVNNNFFDAGPTVRTT